MKRTKRKRKNLNQRKSESGSESGRLKWLDVVADAEIGGGKECVLLLLVVENRLRQKKKK